MKKRIIVLLFGVLLLTGCTADYNLEIDNNLLKEEITGMVSKNELNENNSEAPNTVSSLINEEQYPFANSNEIYDKKLNEDGNNINYKYSFNYDMTNFDKSSLINTCFENHEIVDLGNYYSIKLSGEFYCLYAKNINVNVTSNLNVISNNAKKVKDNTYTWVINKDTTNIEFVVDKTKPFTKNNKKGSSTFRIISFVILMVLSGITYLLYKKKSNNEI